MFSLTIPVPTALVAIAVVMGVVLVIKFLIRFVLG